MSHLDDERAEMQRRLRQHGPPEGLIAALRGGHTAQEALDAVEDTERPDEEIRLGRLLHESERERAEAMRLLKALLGFSASAPITRASIALLDEARAFVRDTEQEQE